MSLDGRSPGAKLLPAVLSLIAGSTDAIGFIGLGGLFTAHVTGNLVILAAHIVAGEAASAALILSVPVFFAALCLTKLMAVGLERAQILCLLPLLGLQFLLLCAFFVFSIDAGPRPDPNSANAIIAGMLGVSAMAVQNALARISLKNVPSTAVMTTNVTHFMLDVGQVLAGGDGAALAQARERAARTLPVILGFIAGCGLGAAYEAAAGLWSLSLPTALAAIACVMGFACEHRTQ